MKKCRACKTKFEPHNSLQAVCSASCALVLVRRTTEQNAKTQRKWVREQKERLKSRGKHEQEAQKIFNAYIRARDASQPCISCETYSAGQYHAGHYRSVGAHPELRFDEANVHKQCAQCNKWRSGNVVDYRINLIKRIGQAEVDRLEGPTPPKHYSVEALIEIKAKYRAMTRELAKQSKAA